MTREPHITSNHSAAICALHPPSSLLLDACKHCIELVLELRLAARRDFSSLLRLRGAAICS